jgi:hypothetical protein
MSGEPGAINNENINDQSCRGSFRDIASVLEAADLAYADGQGRLAIHLYCAAFEMEQPGSMVLSSRVVDGLRKAWNLACELKDRPTAEELFGLLTPYNTSEETEQGILRLQGLAVSQLEGLGITPDDLETMAEAISQEASRTNDNPLFDSIRNALEQLGFDTAEDNEQQSGSTSPTSLIELVAKNQTDIVPAAGIAAKSADTSATEKSKKATRERRLDYEALAGYHDTIDYMKRFGFVPVEFEHARQFMERASALHGVYGLALSEPFFFYGPSRQDVSFFAHATAGEIGWPVLHIDVELDPDGSGTIKLAGPFKRGFLGGPPDIMELDTPCTVLIENIDYLQKMFGTEERAGGIIESNGRPLHGRSLRNEMTAYLKALLKKPGVFLIVTAATSETLQEPLRSAIGVVQKIAVDAPNDPERLDVWKRFSSDHPSFAELDLGELAQLSQGVSRHSIIMAGHAAVDKAYRESLKSGEITNVSLGEVLSELAGLLDHDSEVYRRLEDAAVAQLYRDLEQGQF